MKRVIKAERDIERERAQKRERERKTECTTHRQKKIEMKRLKKIER